MPKPGSLVSQGLTPPRSATLFDTWVERGGFFATNAAFTVFGSAYASPASRAEPANNPKLLRENVTSRLKPPNPALKPPPWQVHRNRAKTAPRSRESPAYFDSLANRPTNR